MHAPLVGRCATRCAICEADAPPCRRAPAACVELRGARLLRRRRGGGTTGRARPQVSLLCSSPSCNGCQRAHIKRRWVSFARSALARSARGGNGFGAVYESFGPRETNVCPPARYAWRRFRRRATRAIPAIPACCGPLRGQRAHIGSMSQNAFIAQLGRVGVGLLRASVKSCTAKINLHLINTNYCRL